MVRKRDYTEDEAAKVVDMLASGRTFRVRRMTVG